MNESPNESKRAQVSNLCPVLLVDGREVENLFEILDTFGGFNAPLGELSIAFVSKEEISRIHGQFMKDDSATDVITFPGDRDDEIAGEICVCPEVAKKYSEENGTNFSEELTLYLAHGYLHLCGFDDVEENDRIEMRKAETNAMRTISHYGAMPRFALKT